MKRLQALDDKNCYPFGRMVRRKARVMKGKTDVLADSVLKTGGVCTGEPCNCQRRMNGYADGGR
jgi:hypothetical protein